MEYCMFSGQVANGKLFRENMDQDLHATDDSSNGSKKEFSKRSGSSY